MRIRHFLLSSVVFGGVVMISTISMAQTAPKVVFKPQGEWAVTRVAAKGPGKDPYCTMARRFGENTILTFARNAKDETSLAMDFQPDTLAKGQSYYVTLDAGADEKRAFDVTPVSDKAMVIRLGQDTAFHDALNRSGVLNVDVAGLQFQFDVPDMNKGHQDLGGCVTSILEPAAGQAPAVVTAAAEPVVREPVSSPSVTSEEIMRAPASVAPAMALPPVSMNHQAMQSESEALKEENMRLRSALERERREYEDRFMKESAGSSQVSEVMEKVKLLEKENSDLKYQLADARSMAPKTVADAPPVAIAAPAVCAPKIVTEKDPAQEAELSLLREENGQLKADLVAQKTALSDLEMKLAQAPQESEKKWATDTATITRLQSRVDELMAENSKLQSDLMTAQAAASVKEDGSITLSQLRSVEEQLRSAESERDSLRAQIEKAGQSNEDSLLKVSGSDWNLEQATRRFNEAEREIRRLGSQLEQARTQCSAEKKEIEYMLFDPEIATKQQISKLMSLETELNTAKAELARKDTDAGGKLGVYEQKISEYESRIADYDTKMTALQDELSAVRQTAPQQMSSHVAATQELAEKVAQADIEKSRMAQRIAQLEQERMRNVAAVEPASGTVSMNVETTAAPLPVQNSIDVGGVEVVSSTMDEQVYSPSSIRTAGYVSTRPADEESAAPVSLPPKSMADADSFIPTQSSAGRIAMPVGLMTSDVLAQQLRQAGLTVTSDIRKIEKISGPDLVAFNWDSAGLFGSAEQKVMADPEQFGTMISQYLDKTKSRCAGDFAASPVPVQAAGGIQVDSYEIACIAPDGSGASAAIAFYGQGGMFTAVAHEAGMDAMDLAMDARDRVIASLTEIKTVN